MGYLQWRVLLNQGAHTLIEIESTGSAVLNRTSRARHVCDVLIEKLKQVKKMSQTSRNLERPVGHENDDPRRHRIKQDWMVAMDPRARNA